LRSQEVDMCPEARAVCHWNIRVIHGGLLV
jgi:hypothetical protein